ncbi:hypothetical protein OAA62_00325 [bacterium]|nr:hypothetical protein [bacterium]
MIHYITCHFGTDELIDLQLRYIKENTNIDYKVWMSYTSPTKQEIDIFHSKKDGRGRCAHFNKEIIDNNEQAISKHREKCHAFRYIPMLLKTTESTLFQIFDFNVGRYIASKNHQNNLHIMTEMVLQDSETRDDDIIVWIDSDSLILKNIKDIISDNNFTAAQRSHRTLQDGNKSLLPHPLFSSCSVGFFKEHKLNWLGGGAYGLTRNDKNWFADTGGYIYAYFKDKNIEWYPITKTRSLCDLNDYFEIYGESILHLGSISLSKVRPAISRELNKDSIYNLYNEIKNGDILKINENA